MKLYRLFLFMIQPGHLLASVQNTQAPCSATGFKTSSVTKEHQDKETTFNEEQG